MRAIYENAFRERFAKRHRQAPNLLYRLVCDAQYTVLEIFRKRYGAMLQCADSAGYIDAQVLGRLRSDDDAQFRSAYAELEVLHFFAEHEFPISVRPRGRPGREGDIQLELDPPVFVEVKAVLDRPLKARESRISEKLWRYAIAAVEGLPGNCVLDLCVEEYAGDFRGKAFANWLQLNLRHHDLARSESLIYEDASGFRLRVIVHPQSPELKRPALMQNHGVATVLDHLSFAASIRDAYEQLPDDGRPTLVVLRPQSPSISSEPLLTALLGWPGVVYTVGSPDVTPTRTGEGLFRRPGLERLSCAGLLRGGAATLDMTESLHVVHYDLARSALDWTRVAGSGIHHFVRVDQSTMAWMPPLPDDD